MGMIKLTKERSGENLILYVNTDYIQAIGQHPNVKKGNVPTVVDMMNGVTRYQVMESVDTILKMIKGKDPFHSEI